MEHDEELRKHKETRIGNIVLWLDDEEHKPMGMEWQQSENEECARDDAEMCVSEAQSERYQHRRLELFPFYRRDHRSSRVHRQSNLFCEIKVFARNVAKANQ